MSTNRYALLTVDTEALPNRAESDHVRRLMLGVHEKGTAGVREMCAIGNDFGAKHVFFVDMCGALKLHLEIKEVISWLDKDGQDVELHVHPEYLHPNFWKKYKLNTQPRFLNQYRDHAREKFLLTHFADVITQVTGKKIIAFRAGSFRWNATTLRVLKELDIPLSFNNTIVGMQIKQNPYSVPTSKPFVWSNGIYEIPVTEKNILPQFADNWWARFQYPLSKYVKYRPWWQSFIPYSVSRRDGFLVCLIHSWSLLYRDEQGYEVYRDDKLLEGYRKLVKAMSKDYDIITSRELLELIKVGKIIPTHTEDIAKAEIGGGK